MSALPSRSGLLRGAAIALCLALPLPASAQIERSDLARALREFEAKFESAIVSDAAREAVREPVARAVASFFRGDSGTVMRSLGDAIDRLDGAAPDPRRDLLRSLGLEFESRFLEPGGAPLRASLVQFMEPARPLDWRELVAEVRVDGRPVSRSVITRDTLSSGGLGIEVRSTDLEPGTHEIEVRLALGREPLGAVAARTFDVEKDAGARTRAALAKIETLRASCGIETRRGLALATAEERLAYVTRALEGQDEEVEAPPRSTLLEMERWLGELEKGEDPLSALAGDQLLAVSAPGGARLPFRAYIPPERKSDGVAVVLALHGAGGNEHMYFEAYGAGAVRKEAARRGFAVVAPRSPGAFSLRGDHGLLALEALSRVVKIDPSRRFLTGHSMGAGQALSLAESHPGFFAALAPIAGGFSRRAEALEALRATPVLLACGDADSIAIGSCRALARDAAAAGLGSFRYVERPGVDHLMIVGDTMPLVFAHFDAATVERR